MPKEWIASSQIPLLFSDRYNHCLSLPLGWFIRLRREVAIRSISEKMSDVEQNPRNKGGPEEKQHDEHPRALEIGAPLLLRKSRHEDDKSDCNAQIRYPAQLRKAVVQDTN